MTTYLAAVNETALAVFAVVVGVTMVITYFASKRVSTATDFWAAGRGLTGPQNGFAIAGDYMSAASLPRHRRPDLPVRLRRLPVLRRLPGRVPDRAVPARRAHAQLGQVHDRRRARVPAEAPARACRRCARHAVGRRLLPDRADGRRGCPHRGPRGDRLLARRRAHRRVHDHLHRRRRNARHELGADHQGVPADGRRGRDDDLGAGERSAGTRSTCSATRARSRRMARPT